MPAKTPTPARTLALDGDKLGFIAGSTVALGVALVQMFLRDADLLTTLVRSGWAFVAAYAAVFFLVRTILRTTLFEMLAEKESRRDARRQQLRDAREKAAAAMGVAAGTGTPRDSAAGQP
jgi:hypothetical protein